MNSSEAAFWKLAHPLVKNPSMGGFPGGLVVRHLPANARDMGLIPHAMEELSSCTTIDLMCPRVCALQQEKPPQ